MRLVSKTDSAGWLRVPASTSQRPYIHGTSLPPLCSQSTNQKRGATPPVWQESQRSDPVIPSTQPTLQKHAASRRSCCSNNTPLSRPCCLRTQSYICLQSCLLHLLSVRLPLDFPPGPGSLPVCLFFCLPRLNPHRSFSLFFFFSWYGKSALETQFTCSHFKPAVSANTQLLRWMMSFLIEISRGRIWEQ